MNQLLLLLFVLGLSACGSGDPAPSASSSFKRIFSVWVDDSTGAIIDLQAGSFNKQYPFNIELKSGGECSCNFFVTGSDASGNFVFSNCVFNAMGTGASDPGCASENSNGTFTDDGTKLTACNPTCSSYH